MKNYSYIFFILISAFIVQLSEIQAATYTWKGGVDSVFTNSNNWLPNTGYPGSSDTCIIETGTSYYPVLAGNRDVYYLKITSGAFDLKAYDFTVTGYVELNSGTLNNGLLIVRGLSTKCNGTTINSRMDVISGVIEFNGGIYNNTSYFEVNGSSNSNGNGGCVFNGNVTIVQNSPRHLYLAKTYGDEFNGNLKLYLMNGGALFMSDADSSYFNGNVYVNNEGTNNILFGNNNGVSFLASGKTIAVGDSGFAVNDLYLNKWTQIGSTTQGLTLTGSANLFLSYCTFNATTALTAPGILCSNSTFNGETTIEKSGTGSNYWTGSNSFYGETEIKNNGSGTTTDILRLSNTYGNDFHENVTFIASGKTIQVDYNDSTEFYGDISINSILVFFKNCVVLKGSNPQDLNGSATYAFVNLVVDKTLEDVIANNPIEVINILNLENRNLVTDTTNVLTMKAGSSVVNASDSSFVNGPVKKIGNTAFEFPVGKGESIRPVNINAPGNINDAFIAEYFDETQQLGYVVDSTIRFLSTCNYWNIARTNGSSSVYISYKYDQSYCDGRPIKPANIGYWNDSLWINLGLATDNGAYKVTPTSINAFGTFLIAYSVGAPYEEDINDYCSITTLPALASDCTPNSTAYIQKYGRAFHYIPESSDPVKTIRVNFNIFQDDNGDCNFQNAGNDLDRLDNYRDQINNTYYSNLAAHTYLEPPAIAGQPVLLPGLVTQPGTITDSRIQFDINYYFYQDDALNVSNDIQACYNAVISADPTRANALNIMFTNGNYGAGGYTFGVSNPTNTAIMTFRAYNSNGSTPCASEDIGDWFRAGHLAHEIGHALELNHTYQSGSGGMNAVCNEADPDYLWDIHGYDVPGGAQAICPWNSVSFPFVSNNLMGGPGGPNNHISPLQLGFIHRCLSLGLQRNWVVCEDFTGHHEIIVDQPEIWDFDIKCYGDIRITTGGSLTNTCKIMMPEDSKIIVEREGILVVDDGIIKGDCELWHGIEVWGDKTESQLPYSTTIQGKAKIINGSEICDMYYGVYAYKDLGNGIVDWDYTGGIIQASNSSFFNNKRAIQLMSYQNFVPGFPNRHRFSISGFSNCTFETNDDLLTNSSNPDNFITIFDVDLYPQTSNTFQNLLSIGEYYDEWERGKGIRAIDSRTNFINNTFSNLWYGIKIDNTISSNSVVLDNNQFSDCDISVRLSNVNFGTIIRCTTIVADRWYFPTGSGNIYNGHPRGFEIEACPMYTVEDNDIRANSLITENAEYGIIANNNGVLPNQFYRNYFYGFRYAGITPQGINSNSPINEGLRLLCNKFEEDKFDDMFIPNGGTIAPIQGYCNCSNPQLIGEIL